MKKFVLGLASVFLLATSSLSNANVATLDGWGINNLTPDGAKSRIDAQKTVADIAKKSHAMIAPTAKDVGKVLVRGAGGFALSIAVDELLGAVDWVLDPANNQIKYYPPNAESDPTYQWVYDGVLYNSATAACRAFWNKTGFGWTFVSVDQPDREYPGCVGYNAEQNRYDAYQPTQRVARIEPIEEKTLPLETVAAQVISNAESDDADAQAATTAAAQDILNEAEQDAAKAQPIVNQLEANAKYSKGGKQNQANEYVRRVQNKENGDEDPCKWLKNLRNSETDPQIKLKIKKAEKHYNCDGKNRFDKK
ncbi:hypothetical protein [Acinetobacter sp. Marseille-Q1618]|uniref:hypothetical protein n=1 Tax=Acinetobacter sp. Marseille-Q1618 TaxID=2697502 RepID=UPI00156EEE55|nr:hypothetical protein [Acinetobacter sp. Marseille-Q1618]